MIKNLQRALGVTQDGIAGRGTYTALFRKCTRPSSSVTLGQFVLIA